MCVQQQLSKSNYTASLLTPHAAFNYKRKNLKDHLEHLDGLVQALDDMDEEEKEAARKEKMAMELPNQPQDWSRIMKLETPEPRAVRPLMGDITHLVSEHKEIKGTCLVALHKKRMKERRGPYYSNLTLSAPNKSDADIRKSLPPELQDIPVSSLKVLHRMRMRHVIMCWNTWKHNAETLAYQRRLLTKVVSRVTKAKLFRFFDKWQTKTQKSREKRERAFRLRLRLRSVLWQPGLIWAASKGSMRVLTWIQQAPMGVSAPMMVSWRHPTSRRTLLHYACEKGRGKMAAFLMGIGVNPHALDAHGNNCMHLACTNKHTGIVEMLVQRGLDPRVMEDGAGGNVMQLYEHANIMSDQRRIPITNFKLKKKKEGGR